MRGFLAAFYTNDGLIQSRSPVLLQSSFDILIGPFDRVGLKTNTTKTKVMVCVPGRFGYPSPQRSTTIAGKVLLTGAIDRVVAFSVRLAMSTCPRSL